MIQPRTLLKVADNSGAKVIRCFRVLKGSKAKWGEIGDIIVASVQVAEPRKEIKKGDVVKALIVRQRKPFRRKDGSYIVFGENAAVIINERQEPVGNRIFGPLPREIKEKGFEKIAALANELV
ncbi:MAG: 50S ribosomal protein L14 [Candidatus Paceibacterota bacterium]